MTVLPCLCVFVSQQCYLTVPMNSTGSCGMMDSLLRRSFRPIAEMSTPSIRMVPAAGSTILNRATPKEDFPAEQESKGDDQDVCFTSEEVWKISVLILELRSQTCFYFIIRYLYFTF